MPDEKMTLIEKLLNPAWRASKDSEWADLAVEQTVETMREAAKALAEIDQMRAALNDSQSLLVAMLLEGRPESEIEAQVGKNRKALGPIIN